MSSQPDTQHQQHVEDPQHLGWCAHCRRAYPCPSTLTRAEARALLLKFRNAR